MERALDCESTPGFWFRTCCSLAQMAHCTPLARSIFLKARVLHPPKGLSPTTQPTLRACFNASRDRRATKILSTEKEVPLAECFPCATHPQTQKLRPERGYHSAQVKSHAQEVERPGFKARAPLLPFPSLCPYQVSSREHPFAATRSPWALANCCMGHFLPKGRNRRLDERFPDGSRGMAQAGSLG